MNNARERESLGKDQYFISRCLLFFSTKSKFHNEHQSDNSLQRKSKNYCTTSDIHKILAGYRGGRGYRERQQNETSKVSSSVGQKKVTIVTLKLQL